MQSKHPRVRPVAVMLQASIAVVMVAKASAADSTGFWLGYLNTDAAIDRREWMESQFAKYNSETFVHRVRALPWSRPFDGAVVAKHQRLNYLDYQEGTYSFGELSEIGTSQEVYRQVHANQTITHTVLLEDDVVLFPGWVEALLDEVAKAPAGWDVLQFHVNNVPVREQMASICEPFVRWMPEYWGAAVVVASASGISRLASKPVTSKEHTVIDYWSYHGLETYTHTRNLFGDRAFATRMQLSAYETPAGPAGPPSHCSLEAEWPNVFAFTVTRDPAEPGFVGLLERAVRSTPRSFDFVVFSTSAHTHERRLNAAAPPGEAGRAPLHIPCEMNGLPRVSKWVCLAQRLDMLRRTDRPYRAVFAFDDDLLFDAFPWKTLLARLSPSWPTIVGIPRESDFANSQLDMRPYFGSEWQRDYFVSSNADYWRNRTCDDRSLGPTGFACDGKWNQFHAPTQRHELAPVKHVETGCTMLDTQFLTWYMHEVAELLRYQETSTSDWGFDHMWCGAADTYGKQHGLQSQSCVMAPLAVWHVDRGSLTGHYSSGNTVSKFAQIGLKQLDWLNKVSLKFRGWYDASAPQRAMTGKNTAEEYRAELRFEEVSRLRALQDAAPYLIHTPSFFLQAMQGWKSVAVMHSHVLLAVLLIGMIVGAAAVAMGICVVKRCAMLPRSESRTPAKRWAIVSVGSEASEAMRASLIRANSRNSATSCLNGPQRSTSSEQPGRAVRVCIPR